jgi:hypothetical protein
MTPKQKAIEIVEKYEKYLYDKNTQDEEWVKCVECSLIAVDEILRIINLEMPGCCETIDRFIYWNKVKRQIEAL